jgi:hypothetical protein
MVVDYEEDFTDPLDDPKYKKKSNLHHYDTNLLNLNGNILCAIDILTTGIDPKKDQIFEICILPLNSYFKPHKMILPFHLQFQPNKDNIDFENLPKGLNRNDVFEACLNGMHPYAAADRFEEWYKKIKLHENKRICPLSYNWIPKYEFMIAWLGLKHYNLFFDYAYRDLLAAALYANDKCDFHAEAMRYPKYDLQYLFSQQEVEGAVGKYDTLMNCISMAECYKMMLKDLV